VATCMPVNQFDTYADDKALLRRVLH